MSITTGRSRCEQHSNDHAQSFLDCDIFVQQKFICLMPVRHASDTVLYIYKIVYILI